MGFCRVHLSGDLLAALLSEGTFLHVVEGLPPGTTFEGVCAGYLVFWHEEFSDHDPPVIRQLSFSNAAALALTAADLERLAGGELVRRSAEQVVMGAIPPGEDRSDAETQHVLAAVSRYVRPRRDRCCGPGGCGTGGLT